MKIEDWRPPPVLPLLRRDLDIYFFDMESTEEVDLSAFPVIRMDQIGMAQSHVLSKSIAEIAEMLDNPSTR